MKQQKPGLMKFLLAAVLTSMLVSCGNDLKSMYNQTACGNIQNTNGVYLLIEYNPSNPELSKTFNLSPSTDSAKQELELVSNNQSSYGCAYSNTNNGYSTTLFGNSSLYSVDKITYSPNPNGFAGQNSAGTQATSFGQQSDTFNYNICGVIKYTNYGLGNGYYLTSGSSFYQLVADPNDPEVQAGLNSIGASQREGCVGTAISIGQNNNVVGVQVFTVQYLRLQ
ncbi:MAG: hypothetical protein ACI9QD_000031 [Thermoproteota archaeon]|jgi:hypothetical protein